MWFERAAIVGTDALMWLCDRLRLGDFGRFAVGLVAGGVFVAAVSAIPFALAVLAVWSA